MPLFKIDNQEILFIHIPKTGGTSIERWLSEIGDISFYSTVVPSFLKCSPQHFTLSNYKVLTPSLDCPAFTIVRDPYDRAESEYFFRVGSQPAKMRPDFSVWMLKHLQNVNRNEHHFDNHFMPQSYFIEDGIDVFRFEEGLDKIVEKVAGKYSFEVPKTTPHANPSKRSEVKWSTELLVKFNRYYAVDFEMLQYPIKEIKKV